MISVPQEGKTGEIVLEDDSDVIDAMLKFMYEGRYIHTPVVKFAPAVFHVKVAAIGEKYFVNGLIQQAAEFLKDTLAKQWHADAFMDAVDEWWTSCTDPEKLLSDQIVYTVAIRHVELFAPGQERGRFRKFLDEKPWIAAEIAARLARQDAPFIKANLKTYSCTHGCGAKMRAILEAPYSFAYECSKCRQLAAVRRVGRRP